VFHYVSKTMKMRKCWCFFSCAASGGGRTCGRELVEKSVWWSGNS